MQQPQEELPEQHARGQQQSAGEPPLEGATRAEEPAASATAAASTPKKKKKKRRTVIGINLANCKYEVVRSVQQKLGWKETDDEGDWHIYWTDTSVSMERVMRLRRVQKINHFAGMLEICRKKSLAKNLGRMLKAAPDDYGFAPQSFQLPAEMDDLLAQFERGKRKTYILKPDAGCQGKGITLAQSASAVESAMRQYQAHSCENLVAQRYLHRPFLVNGHKFDLRIYVLVLSCDPLRVFLYDEGLVRFCTEPYEAPKGSNLDQVCMHLTNYAVNKHNDNFKFNEGGVEGMDDEDSKWALSAFFDYLAGEGHDVDKLWAAIKDLVIKTLISAQPLLAHNYRLCTAQHEEDDGFRCFELLGLDVMLDWKLRPWLIEANHSPSFTTDTALDLQIKEALIEDTLALARMERSQVRQAKKAEREDMKQRLYSTKRRASVASSDDAKGKGKAKAKPVAKPGDRNLSRAESAQKDRAKDRAEEAARRASQRAEELAARSVYEEAHRGGYQRIYPVPGDDLLAESLEERYERLLGVSKSVFERYSCLGRTQAALDKRNADMKRVAERGGPPPPTLPRARPAVAAGAGAQRSSAGTPTSSGSGGSGDSERAGSSRSGSVKARGGSAKSASAAGAGRSAADGTKGEPSAQSTPSKRVSSGHVPSMARSRALSASSSADSRRLAATMMVVRRGREEAAVSATIAAAQSPRATACPLSGNSGGVGLATPNARQGARAPARSGGSARARPAPARASLVMSAAEARAASAAVAEALGKGTSYGSLHAALARSSSPSRLPSAAGYSSAPIGFGRSALLAAAGRAHTGAPQTTANKLAAELMAASQTIIPGSGGGGVGLVCQGIGVAGEGTPLGPLAGVGLRRYG